MRAEARKSSLYDLTLESSHIQILEFVNYEVQVAELVARCWVAGVVLIMYLLEDGEMAYAPATLLLPGCL